MILRALVELADKEQLVPDPDFEIKPVSWVIVLKPDGTLAQIESRRSNLNEGTERKPKYVGNPMEIPRQPIRTRGDSAFFLVDKSEYALGFDPAGARDAEKLRIRLELFREQISSCATAIKEPDVQAVVNFLNNIANYRDDIEESCKHDLWAPNDMFAFRVGTHECVHLRQGVRNYWKSLRTANKKAADDSSLRCLVSGESIGEVGLFPLLKRVPGGTSSGVSLVSFNASAFESYGLKGNEKRARLTRGCRKGINRAEPPAERLVSESVESTAGNAAAQHSH
ncbi:MAG TPA: type I-C CRISPR-associated protein Cas8c/Csd1 [Pirellulales bacterium]|nr:type I-C CRISPR-associated protein Cas8c/Csd1 [Pirellulales bacterium]